MSNLTTFAKRLKEARLKAGLTQAQLAKKAHTTAATISSYESIGIIKKASLDLAMSFAQALDVSLDWLCGIDESELKKGYSTEFTAKEYLYSLVRVITEMSTISDDEVFSPDDGVYIHITQKPLSVFIRKIIDLLKVYRAGTLTEDLFITCVDKVVNDYSEYSFMFDNFLNYDEADEADTAVMQIIEEQNDKGSVSAGTLTTSFSSPQSRKNNISLFVNERYVENYLKQDK